MTHYISGYIICGVLFNLFYDLIISSLHAINEDSEKLRFNMRERLFMVLVWPIATIFFIVGLLKEYLRRK
jgi:hypothetical protein